MPLIKEKSLEQKEEKIKDKPSDLESAGQIEKAKKGKQVEDTEKIPISSLAEDKVQEAYETGEQEKTKLEIEPKEDVKEEKSFEKDKSIKDDLILKEDKGIIDFQKF